MPGIIDTAFVRVVPEFGGFAGAVRTGITQSFAPVRGIVAGQMGAVESRVAQTGARTSGIFATMAGGIRRTFSAVGSTVTGALASLTGVRLGGGAAISAVIAGIGVAAVKMAGEFQSSVVRLETGAGEAHSALKMVGNGMLDIARSTGTSTKQVADGMYLVESAGFHGQKGLDIMKAAAQGAKVDMADAHVVADALTTAMVDLGKGAGPPATVMSQLVAIVGHGKTTMDQLAGSLHSVLPNATALHLGLGEVGGALATMTAQGIGAQQASQNLNHAILSLANPTAVQTKAMAALGLNASEVARDLGTKGLSGTLSELSSAILQHMGPAGLTLTNALNTSQIAAGKANTAYQAMSPQLRSIADAMKKGVGSAKAVGDSHANLTLQEKTLLQQWTRLQKTASGFSDVLKAGSPEAMTYSAALARMTGGQVGLQVALHLTGENMPTYLANIAAINKAHMEGGGNVEGWAVKQRTFNQRMSELKEVVVTAFIAVGMQLLPVLTTFAGFIVDHVVPAVSTLLGVIGFGIRTLRSFGEMLGRNQVPLMAIGATITAFVLPALIGLATAAAASAAATAVSIGETIALWTLYKVEALTNAGRVVVAFVMTQVAGIKAAAAAAVSFAAMVAGWVATGAAAAVNAARVAAAWLVVNLGSARAIAASIAGLATMIANWVRLGATATVQAARVAAAWIASAGPVVLALAAVGAAIYQATRGWTSQQITLQANKKLVEGLTAALQADSGALGVNTRAQVANDLEKSGALKTAQSLGIGLGQLTDGMLGNAAAANAVGDQLRALSKAHPELRGKIGDLIVALDIEGKSLGVAEAGQKRVTDATGKATTAAGKAATATDTVTTSTTNSAIATVRSSIATASATTVAKLQKTALDLLTGALANLNGTILTNLQSEDAFHTALNSIATQVKNNNTPTLIGYSDAAISNRAVIFQASQAILDHVDKMVKDKVATQTIIKYINDHKTSLENAAIAAGEDAGQVHNLTDKLLHIPKEVTSKINADTSAANRRIADTKATLDFMAAHPYAVQVTATGDVLFHSPTGGTARAAGGVLPGWSPGYDNLTFFNPKVGKLHLSGGEGILIPEAVKALGGERGINQINKEARVGHFRPGLQGSGTQGRYRAGFQSGGIIELNVNFDIPERIKEQARLGPVMGLGGAGGPATVGGSLGQWIAAALAITGTPGSWGGAVERRIMFESGGNPGAINLWDSNAQAGYPSQGLMQTIPQTFNAYHAAGTSYSITDPIANIAAALNYIKSRYGTIFAIDPPVQGYARGAWEIPRSGLGMLHKSEMVIPPKPAAAIREAAETRPGRGAQLDERAIAAAVANGVAAALGGIAIRFDADGLARLVSSKQALTAARGVRR